MAVDERIARRWLARGQKFFTATTKSGIIRGALAARGLSRTELDAGWKLYSRVLGFGIEGTVPPPPDEAEMRASDAMGQIDAWDAPAYRAMHAVLDHRYPAASAILFDGVTADVGPRAVAGVARLLENYSQLKSGKPAGVSAAEAKAAVQLLEKRQLLSADIVIKLSDLIEKAQGGAQFQDLPEQDDEAYEASFEEYRNWLNEWREVARSTFTRRSYLISLGLASRRTRGSTSESPGGEDELEDDESAVA